jgi:hypothetical protein
MKRLSKGSVVRMSVASVLVAFVYSANAANAETRKIPYNPQLSP